MKPRKVESIRRHHASGVLSGSEAATALLEELARDETLDTAFLSSLGNLPQDIQREFVELLGRIRSANFEWKMFLIGGGPISLDPKRLRQICEIAHH